MCAQVLFDLIQYDFSLQMFEENAFFPRRLLTKHATGEMFMVVLTKILRGNLKRSRYERLLYKTGKKMDLGMLCCVCVCRCTIWSADTVSLLIAPGSFGAKYAQNRRD